MHAQVFELAAGATGTQANHGSALYSYGIIIVMFVLLYFVLIRPNQKRQKQRNQLLSSLGKGDKVVTIGGIRGTITEMNDDTIVLRVNDTTRLTFDRSAISSISEKFQSSEKANNEKQDKEEKK